ncbi:hypothetical protein E1B28_005270 [Marasmius oreades]|uniref:Uncharacterized protein n=1 Tax=Marasmius oreades TaxID=181124 RepID=A0A9P7V0A1_9AGAR|nr:uncharacterized protein E1B28_005270 [Marasmius oreades]KAG7097959.1 hypothetical protein E1B28_005270 [Marasmius oreades]
MRDQCDKPSGEQRYGPGIQMLFFKFDPEKGTEFKATLHMDPVAVGRLFRFPIREELVSQLP